MCTWMFVRTHWWSVRECMTPEQYDAYIESMHHSCHITRWVVAIIVVVVWLLIWLEIWLEKGDPYSDYWYY